MTRAEKVAEVQRLRGEGLSYSAIGQRVGHPHSTIYKWLHPEWTRHQDRRQNGARGPAKREWDEAHRLPCTRCGQPMSAGSARASGRRSCKVVGDVCANCQRRGRADRALAMVELRRERGLTNAEIAAEVGCAVLTVTQELSRMRSLGFDVPLAPYAVQKGMSQRAATLTRDSLWLGGALAERGVDVPALREQRAA